MIRLEVLPTTRNQIITTLIISYTGNLAEWLRRKIRNLLGSARAGSSPAVVELFLLIFSKTLP